MSISRRQFFGTTALGSVAASSVIGADGKIPERTLGRTGRKVTILAFGCGSRFLSYKEEEAGGALNRAIDLGIKYVDTAYGYGDGESETRVGRVMKTRRNEVFLATKVNRRNGDEARRIIEGSLKRLQTDHVDLLHIHALMDERDLAAIEAKDGVLNVLYKLREEKVARAIGITCHAFPEVLKTALERHDFDCTQMALNAGLMGAAASTATAQASGAGHSFQSIALPVANRKKLGVIAMKVFAQEKLLGRAPVEKLVRYSMSLPVTAAVVGMPTLDNLEENVRIAKTFKPLPATEMRDLAKTVSAETKASLDRFFCNHVDA